MLGRGLGTDLGGSRMTRKAVVTLVAVALWAGGFVSEATATPRSVVVHPPGKLCNPNVCSEEVAAACPGLKAKAFNRCRKDLIANCRSGVCSCTGDPTLPACGPTTTSTSSTTTSSSTPTTSSSTTTSPTTSTTSTTTATNIQCCVPGSPGGAFTCELLTAAACTAAGGINNGPGTCVPDPCAATTSTSTTSTTSTTSSSTTTTTTATTSTSTTSTTTTTTATTTTATNETTAPTAT